MDSKKWLIFGCGGCLLLVIIAAIVVAGLIFFGVGKMGDMGKDVSKEFFGEEPPSGYSVQFGFSFQDTSLVSLMNQADQSMLMVMGIPTSPAEYEKLTQDMSPEQASAFAEQMMSQAQSGNTNGRFTMKETVPLKLAKGDHMAFLVEVEGKNGQGVMPAAMTFLPYPHHRMVMVILMKMVPASQDPAENKAMFAQMVQNLVYVIDDTALSEKMVMIQKAKPPAAEDNHQQSARPLLKDGTQVGAKTEVSKALKAAA